VWLDRPEQASFDVIAIFHGSDPTKFSCPLCKAVVPLRGPKWRLFMQLAMDPVLWDPIAAAYDYIMLPDDDLQMDTCTVNRVITIMRDYDLLLAQPSVCARQQGATWRKELYQRPQYVLRYNTFVEVMAPTFRMDFYHQGE
jgi:hypothetical protein